MPGLTRTKKYAELREKMAHDAETSTSTEQLSAFEHKLENLQGISAGKTEIKEETIPAAPVETVPAPAVEVPAETPVFETVETPVQEEVIEAPKEEIPAEETAPEETLGSFSDIQHYLDIMEGRPVEENHSDTPAEMLSTVLPTVIENPAVDEEVEEPAVEEPAEEVVTEVVPTVETPIEVAPEETAAEPVQEIEETIEFVPETVYEETPADTYPAPPAEPVYKEAEADSENYLADTLSEVDAYNRSEGRRTMEELSSAFVDDVRHPEWEEITSPVKKQESAPVEEEKEIEKTADDLAFEKIVTILEDTREIPKITPVSVPETEKTTEIPAAETVKETPVKAEEPVEIDVPDMTMEFVVPKTTYIASQDSVVNPLIGDDDRAFDRMSSLFDEMILEERGPEKLRVSEPAKVVLPVETVSEEPVTAEEAPVTEEDLETAVEETPEEVPAETVEETPVIAELEEPADETMYSPIMPTVIENPGVDAVEEEQPAEEEKVEAELEEDLEDLPVFSLLEEWGNPIHEETPVEEVRETVPEIEETPVEETPAEVVSEEAATVEETPVTVEETPAVAEEVPETIVEETPAVEEAPVEVPAEAVEETPVTVEEPAEIIETPAETIESPVETEPVVEEAPAAELEEVYEAPESFREVIEETPVEETIAPVAELEETPVEEGPRSLVEEFLREAEKVVSAQEEDVETPVETAAAPVVETVKEAPVTEAVLEEPVTVVETPAPVVEETPVEVPAEAVEEPAEIVETPVETVKAPVVEEPVKENVPEEKDEEFSNTVSLEIRKIMEELNTKSNEEAIPVSLMDTSDNKPLDIDASDFDKSDLSSFISSYFGDETGEEEVLKPIEEHRAIAIAEPKEEEDDDAIVIKNLSELENEQTGTIEKTIPFVVTKEKVEEEEEDSDSTPNRILNVILAVLIIALVAVLGIIVYYILLARGIIG